MSAIYGKLISNSKYFTLGVAVLFFITLVLILIFPFPVGMADNHDFARLSGRAGITHLSSLTSYEMFNNFINIYYSNLGHHYYPQTMGQVVAYAALFINNIFNSSGTFNILYLGSIYILAYTAAFYIFIKNILAHTKVSFFVKIFLGLFFIFILTDGMFTFYFNSFYQEALSIVLLLLFVSFSLKKKISPVVLLTILLFVSIVKSQNIAFIFLFPLIIYLHYPSVTKRVICIFFILFLAITAYSTAMSKQDKNANVYNSFFYGLLKNTDNNTSIEIIESTGLKSKDYIELVNVGYWPGGANLREKHPEAYNHFYTKVNHSKIILLYFKYPTILINNIYFGLNELFSNPTQPEYMGNTTQLGSNNNQITIINTFLGDNLNYLYIYVYIISIFISLFILKKGKINMSSVDKTILLLTGIAPIVFATNMLGDGFFEFIKHNLIFYFIIALLLIINIFFIVENFLLKTKRNIII